MERRQLDIYEASQWVHGLKKAVAKQLGMDADTDRVINAFAGAPLDREGSNDAPNRHRLPALRRSGWAGPSAGRDPGAGFTIVTYRAETRHHMRNRAPASDGKLTLGHEAREASSRP